MKSLFSSLLFLFIIASLLSTSCTKQEMPESTEVIKKKEAEFKEFASQLQERLAKTYKEYALAYWDASISGKDEDFNRSAELEIKFNELLSNKENFTKIKFYYDSVEFQDPLIKRELHVLYHTFLAYQVDTVKLNAMTLLQNEIAKKFQTFRAQVGKKELTDNDVEEILKTSKDSKKLMETWIAHKNIGPLVAEDIIKLVKMRNEVAQELGFKNYHDMSLRLSDQEPEEISKIFDELDELTRETFAKLKAEIDATLAGQLKIKPEELMPWHYQNRYFQEAPSIYEIDLDIYYKNFKKEDIVELTRKYFASINMPIDEMLAKSDLYEKPGKNQHAYCIDIDRVVKEVRVLCNVKPNYNWMNTMLHEFGHAVYFKYQDNSLPWVLNTPAHTFTTEAIAMLFGRFASKPQWLQDMIGISDEEKNKIDETAYKILKLEQLVFSRWSQVMYRFEKSLYENPDQDLNTLWWDLVEKYQMIKRPAERNMPDWSTKIHIATSPCYYHNYHLGELLASQLYHYINNKVLKLPEGQESSFMNKVEVGEYLIENVFKPGAKYHWNDMIKMATGEKLTAKYYANQFVN